MVSYFAAARFSRQAQDSIRQLSRQDYKQMLILTSIKKGAGTVDMPAIEQGIMDGDVAFRMHAGGHTTGSNWPSFVQFAKRYF